MANGRLLPILLLSGVVVVAHFALAGLGKANGTINLPDVLAYKNRVLAGTDFPIDFPASGIAPVDNAVAFMISVFWAALDPKNVKSHLQGHHFLGGLSAAWILMLIECHRANRTAGFLVFTYFIEVVGELIGVGMTTPLWCVAHLILTAAPSSKAGAQELHDFFPRASSLGSLGYAYFLGHVLPTLLMSFTKPDGSGIWSQQVWTILRLFHPVFMIVLWKAFEGLQSTGNDKSTNLRAAASRKFYTFAILSSALHHASAMSLIYAEHWIPGWVRPDVIKNLNFRSVLQPFPFWRADLIKPVPFTEGVTIFLQWDEALTVTAILIWTTTLYIEFSHKAKTNSGRLSLLLQTLIMTVVGGPIAGGAYLLQERDNLVLNTLEFQSQKKLQ